MPIHLVLHGGAAPIVRKFVWMFLALYGALSLILWTASVATPGSVGPVSSYTIEISLIIGLTFAGLYAAASALSTGNRRSASTHR